MRWTLIPSPIDDLTVVTDGDGICQVGFAGPGTGRPLPAGQRLPAAAEPLLRAAADQLAEYFAGARTEFDLPLSAHRGTDFERAVWAAMATIPYGETRTYGQLAAAVGGQPAPDGAGFEAARAVGVACNRNPLPIVVPCHRVVGAGGKLVGFGGGLARKRFLLELEAGVHLARAFG